MVKCIVQPLVAVCEVVQQRGGVAVRGVWEWSGGGGMTESGFSCRCRIEPFVGVAEGGIVQSDTAFLGRKTPEPAHRLQFQVGIHTVGIKANLLNDRTDFYDRRKGRST